jgi:hypothetical protein
MDDLIIGIIFKIKLIIIYSIVYYNVYPNYFHRWPSPHYHIDFVFFILKILFSRLLVLFLPILFEFFYAQIVTFHHHYVPWL